MLKESFLNYLIFEKAYSDKTVIAYRKDLEDFQMFINDVNEEIHLQDVDTDIVRQWQMMLLDDGRAASTVNRKLSSLRSFFKFLLMRGAIEKDPMHLVVGLKKEKRLPVFLKETEMNQLLDEVSFSDDYFGKRDRLIIVLFYYTGIRLAELVGLNVEDVLMEESVLKVNGKRNKQRLIPYGDELAFLLEEYFSFRSNGFLDLKNKALLYGKHGGRITRAEVQRSVQSNLSKVSTLKKKSPHVLRHTFATLMLNGHASLSAVKELLGHTSLSATEVYTHVSFEEMKDIYKHAHPRA